MWRECPSGYTYAIVAIDCLLQHLKHHVRNALCRPVPYYICTNKRLYAFYHFKGIPMILYEIVLGYKMLVSKGYIMCTEK